MKRSFLLFFLACLLTAGFALAFAGCGGGGDAQTERIVGRLLTAAQEQKMEVQTYVGKMPPNVPWDLPRYPGSKVLVSFVLDEAGQSTYFVMLDSNDAAADVLDFYEGAFDKDPWQVEGFISGQQAMAIQFNKIDDANVSGGLSVDDLPEGGSGVSLSVQLTKESGAQEEAPFELGASRPLPSTFPSDVPLYPDATVTDVTWLRSGGGLEFMVTQLTNGSPQDVIDFYKGELANRGFTATDETPEGSAAVLSFTQAATGGVEGRLSADVFQQDAAYTQVDIQLRVASGQADGS